MKKVNKRIQELAEQAAKVAQKLEDMKGLYAEMDSLTEQLVELGAVGAELVANGRAVVVVDNFQTKNTVFKTTSVKRFELKLVKGGGK